MNTALFWSYFNAARTRLFSPPPTASRRPPITVSRAWTGLCICTLPITYTRERERTQIDLLSENITALNLDIALDFDRVTGLPPLWLCWWPVHCWCHSPLLPPHHCHRTVNSTDRRHHVPCSQMECSYSTCPQCSSTLVKHW